MTREECEQYCKDVYQDFYRETSMYKDFVYNHTDKHKTTLRKFVDYVDNVYGLNSVDINWVVNYIESGFNLWWDIPTRFGVGNVMFPWIFGKKAISRYENIKGKDSRRARHKRTVRLGVGIKIINKYKKKETSQDLLSFVIGIREAEEKEKIRYYNTEEGLLWCISQTTLYNHLSHNCIVCKSKDKCKIILKENYPKIFKKRGYE